MRDLFSTVGPNIADVEEKTTEKTSKTTAGLPSHYRLQYQVANKGKLLEGIQVWRKSENWLKLVWFLSL